VQKYIFYDEQARASAPAFLPFGVSMVGPIVYTFGNDEQKKRFLPDILEFNTWWFVFLIFVYHILALSIIT
jgi:hypothetical protein